MNTNDLVITANSLMNLVSMFVNQCSYTSEYTVADKASMYVTLDAIKAQTVIVTNELDKV